MVTTLAPIANRLITQQLAFRDASALAPFEAGRFYPIRAKQSTQVVPSEYVPHPSTISPDAVRTASMALPSGSRSSALPGWSTGVSPAVGRSASYRGSPAARASARP